MTTARTWKRSAVTRLVVVGVPLLATCSSSDEFGRREEVPVDGGTISVIGPTQPCGAGNLTVLLLHGASFDAATWSEVGVLQRLCDTGYEVLAVDLPGFGETESFDHDRVSLMDELVEFVDGEVVVVFPSMSGDYVLPWISLAERPPLGAVGVAPVGLGERNPSAETLAKFLLIWGSDDDVIPIEVARDFVSRHPVDLVEIGAGGHAPYTTHPNEFADAVIDFVADLPVD